MRGIWDFFVTILEVWGNLLMRPDDSLGTPCSLTTALATTTILLAISTQQRREKTKLHPG